MVGIGPMESSFEKTAVLLSIIDVTIEVSGCKTPVFKVNPVPVKLEMETDSPILHSILIVEPPPLLKVNGVIDWAGKRENPLRKEKKK